MTTELPPFHSLAFATYYRTECQDKYNTSRLAHHVAYFDNECASSLLLTPCLEEETETNSRNSSNHSKIKPSYHCSTFVHGHQYSRKVRCFGPWIDAAGFANATLSEISRTMDSRGTSSSRRSSKSTSCSSNNNHSQKA